MSEPEQISTLQNELARHYSLLVSQLAAKASEQAIAKTRHAIAECKEALLRLGIVVDDEKELATARQHQQTITGNAVVGVAVTGDMTGSVFQQFGGVRYESGAIHYGDNVAGNKIVHKIPPKRPPIDLEEAKRRLAEMPEDVVPPVDNLPVGSRMQPRRTDHFVGRQHDLLTLAVQLKQGGISVITTGIGGVGKSTLASEFAYRYGRYFLGGVFWLSADDPANLASEIAACGGYDAMQAFHESEQLTLEARVARVKAAWEEPIPRLLIFDNWDQVGVRQARHLLERYLPKGNSCRVLITSRNSQWPSDQALHVVPLGVLSRAESIALLQRYRADLSEADANAIAEELGDLPLALYLAGNFLQLYQGETFAIPQIYLRDLHSYRVLNHPGFEDDEDEESSDVGERRREQGLRTTFHLSFQRLAPEKAVDALALKALIHAAFFAPNEPIPQPLLIQAFAQTTDPSDLIQAKRQVDAIKRLLELGFVEQAGDGAVRIHRLIAKYAEETIKDEAAQAQVEQVVIATTHDLVSQGRPALMIHLLPHLRHCYQRQSSANDLRSAELALALGRAEQEQINYRVAEPLFQQAREIYQAQLGEDHPDTATNLNNLAGLYYAQGRYGEAEPLFQQALRIRTAQLGEHHPHTASSLANLAGLYYAQGRYGEAERLFQQALEIHRKQLGEHHPDTTTSLNNLALLYQSQGRYGEAEPLFQQALQIYQAQLGEDHPHTASSLNNLALLYQSQGRYGEAEPLFQQALEIHRKQLGEDHPHTATSLNNLAALYQSQGRYGEAERLYQQALRIRTAQLGEDHPHTASSLNNLALLYQSQGRYGEAERLYQQALQIHRKQLGEDHPDTASSLSNLAGLHLRQAHYQEAEALFQQAISIYERTVGKDHPDTQNARAGLALCQQLGSALSNAKAAVEQAVLNPQIDRTALIQQLEEAAHYYAEGEEEGSPWLEVAAQFRQLAAKLADPEEQDMLKEKLQRASAQVEEALAHNDPEAIAALYERLSVVADAYAGGTQVSAIHAAFATALRELAAKLQAAS